MAAVTTARRAATARRAEEAGRAARQSAVLVLVLMPVLVLVLMPAPVGLPGGQVPSVVEAGGTAVAAVAVEEAAVEAAAVVVAIRRSVAVPAPGSRRSSWSASRHSGTLPCLRRGSSSRLVASIRSPATSFWRVSAGSMTSSM